MEEEELEKLVGKDPVHMAGEGYLALAVNTLKLVESRRTLFVGEKRERTESVEGEGEEIGGWARKHHEWLFETVSGAGGWKQGWAKLVLIALERYSVALKRLTFNLR
jgi:hypothetical protein